MTKNGPLKFGPLQARGSRLLKCIILLFVVCSMVLFVVALYLTAWLSWGQRLVLFAVIR